MKKAFVVANGTARDHAPTGRGRFFPADLLGQDTREIERVMRLRYAAETRDELPALINSVRTGDDDELLHIALFGDVDGVHAAVLEGLRAEAAKGSIANFAQAISLLKIREAAPLLHAHLRALPPDAPLRHFARARSPRAC